MVHTPEGVRDIYGTEYAGKLAVEEKIQQVFHRYGYQDIQTPTFEFFDVFSREIGTRPSRDLYKFFDKEGNTLVLRPDFTPSIARCAAKYFMEEDRPLRFCYLGNAFSNTSELQGKLKEVTQMGCELIGDGSVQADAEMAAMMIAALKSTGLSDFQISIGQVEYYKGICREAGLSEEMELELREYISSKNYFGAEDFLIRKKVPEHHRSMLMKSAELQGGVEILEEASKAVTNERAIAAITRLEQLYQALCTYGVEGHVSFDLGMLSKYNYYTGVILKGYTYGAGDAIITGGRYDRLLGYFGRTRPAIGFMLAIDSLMEALSRHKISADLKERVSEIVYSPDTFGQAVREAETRRRQGEAIVLIPETKLQPEPQPSVKEQPVRAIAEDNTARTSGENRTPIRSGTFLAGAKEDMRYLTFALGKGRLADQTMALLESVGIVCEEMKDKSSRKLIFVNEELRLKFFLSKNPDVPTYVEYGAADIGVVGSDVLREENKRVYEVLDLGFGKCRMCVCGPKTAQALLKHHEMIRVASKYPNIAKDYFYNKKHQTVDMIKLNGSVELGPIVGLSDVIVDIVETGSTLRENGLDVLEEICPISARMIVNRVSMQMEADRIKNIIGMLRDKIS